MSIKAGEYADLKAEGRVQWGDAKGEPEGVEEAVLHKHEDGSYTHVLRIKEGIEFREPIKHDFFEEAYYLEGEMLNTKSNTIITGGSYVYHEPGEEHGPFRCLRTCVILEFRCYK